MPEPLYCAGLSKQEGFIVLYTEATKKAMRLAYRAHHGQMDLGGVPYVFHPYHLAEQMQTEETVCAALLHDVLEDTLLTANDLEREGFSPAIVQAVVHLTHEKQVPYEEYVRQLAADPIARAVKMADLRHNSDETRWPKEEAGTERVLSRREKYRKALAFLEQVEKGEPVV